MTTEFDWGEIPLEIMCPTHQVKLNRKSIMYGLPDDDQNCDGMIMGGCIVSDDDPEYGYECPVDQKVYYLGQDGSLKA